MNSFSFRTQSCPNRDCPQQGQKLQGNISVHSRKQARFRCKSCGVTWVAHRLEFHYGLRSDPRKIARARELLRHGQSVRQVARLISISPSTLQRWKAKIVSEKAPYSVENSKLMFTYS